MSDTKSILDRARAELYLETGIWYDVYAIPETAVYRVRERIVDPSSPEEQNILDIICKSACDAFEIRETQLYGKGRSHEFVDARSMCYFVLCCRNWSTSAIGKEFGGRDHTTILNGRDNHKTYVQTNRTYKKSWERFISLCADRGLHYAIDSNGKDVFILKSSVELMSESEK